MRRRTLVPLVVAVTLSALALAPPAAAMAPVGPPIPLVTTQLTNLTGVAVQPDGGFVVVYRNHVEGEYGGYARLFGTDGSLRRTVRLSPGPFGPETLPTIAMDAEGGFAVAWVLGSGPDMVLEGRLFDAAGNPRTGIIHMSRRHTDGIGYQERLVMRPDGSFFAAWGGHHKALGSVVMVRPFNAGGQPLAAPLAVEISYGAHLHDAAWSPRGELVLLFGRFENGVARLYLRRYGPDLVPRGPAQPVSSPGKQVYDSSLAVLADGRLVVTWGADADPTSSIDILLRLYTADGQPLGAARRAHEAIAGDQLGPLLAPLPEGGFLVAWSDFCDSDVGPCGDGVNGNDGDLTGSFVRHFGADGLPAGPDTLLPTSAAGWQQTFALAGGQGGVVAAYGSQVGAYGNGAYFARRLESPCAADAHTLCLGAGGRFRLRATWQDFQGGSGRAVAVPRDADWGSFWFFRESNLELVAKLLDGRPVNGRFWVFYASLSNVRYELEVVDTAAGSRRLYVNPAGRFASRGDTGALPGVAASTAAAAPPAAGRAAAADRVASPSVCVSTATRLCLGDGRFAAEISWRDFDDRVGPGRGVPLTADTGYFWFFRAGNPEVVLKVLDGRGVNGRFWVFYGALTNVAFDLVVRDTLTGQEVRYENPLGTFASRGDTSAF